MARSALTLATIDVTLPVRVKLAGPSGQPAAGTETMVPGLALTTLVD